MMGKKTNVPWFKKGSEIIFGYLSVKPKEMTGNASPQLTNYLRGACTERLFNYRTISKFTKN